MTQLNRIEPLGPASAYKTYSVAAPRSTHFRTATCKEVECDGYRFGFAAVIDETTELGQGQAYYIRKESGRRFREERLPDGRTMFTFEAGQQCFRSGDTAHMIRLDKPEIYVVRDGDWRGNPRGTEARQHHSADDWIDDMANHQDAIATRIQRG
jgi:hypothetical protein